MLSQTNNKFDALVRLSHRGLILALTLVALLGGSAFMLTMFPESAAADVAGFAMKLLPVAIVIGVAALRPTKEKLPGLSSPQMKAILKDELRQLSLRKAYRNGLIAVLILQPLLMLLMTFVPAAYPLALMASMTVTIGVVVALASLLWYDR
ncbi:MAG: hypothetical protein V4447_10310 [Pseudomonadota bacterium]